MDLKSGAPTNELASPEQSQHAVPAFESSASSPLTVNSSNPYGISAVSLPSQMASGNQAITLPPLASALGSDMSSSVAAAAATTTTKADKGAPRSTFPPINDYTSTSHPLFAISEQRQSPTLAPAPAPPQPLNNAVALPPQQQKQQPQMRRLSDTFRRVPRTLPDTLKHKKQANRIPSSKISKRSRKGCLTCRFRKRKCCETRPVCNECKRLGIKCSWITNGLENKNKSKKNPDFLRNDECYDDLFGVIKIIRGKIDYKIDDGEFVEGNYNKYDDDMIDDDDELGDDDDRNSNGNNSSRTAEPENTVDYGYHGMGDESGSTGLSSASSIFPKMKC